MTEPYDPIAYQAELDARCSRVGSSWLSRQTGRHSPLFGSQKEEAREQRLKMQLLEDPELIDEIPLERRPDEGV